MCRMTHRVLYYQQMDWGQKKKMRIREDRIKQPFNTLWRINTLCSLDSTVIITSMLYCIYRLILLLWV
ncbi:unnamed protein product [Staurois parvus]|uniref:Uncharacterized protein n=1 Tax=Staurois parvus TaxID=386267 RepID=A0ABN9CVU9_9NEOB|nr:unnamed protein product [Staurois parvus]